MEKERGFKFNHSAKEKAMKQLEEETKEKESVRQSREVFEGLGITMF